MAFRPRHMAGKSMLTPARRRTITVLRWIALPLALLCLGGPIVSLIRTYQHYAGMTLTKATIISATLQVAGNKGMGSSYDAYVSYAVNGHTERSNVTLTISFRSLAAGDTVAVFVDPKTGEAEDDSRPDSWVMVALGALAAAFFVLVSFRYSGKILREDAARHPAKSAPKQR